MTLPKQLLTDPFAETQTTILNGFLVGVCIFGFVRLSGPIASTLASGSVKPINLVFIAILTPLLIISLITAVKKDWPYKVRAAILLITLYTIGLQDALVERLVAGNGQLVLIAFVILTTILVDFRRALIATILVLVSVWLINYSAQTTDTSNLIDFYLGVPGFFVPAIIFLIIGSALLVAINRLLETIKLSLENEKNLALDLENESQLLEERIKSRAQALKASTTISREISSLLDEAKILQTSINQIKDIFGYDHIQLYRLDKTTGELILYAATDSAEHQLLVQERIIPMGQTTVGLAGVHQHSVRSINFDNADKHILPDTKVEASIPILFEQELYGILNIQDIDAAALTEDELYSVELITEQIAVTLHNAHLYAHAQKLLARESIINSISQKLQMAKNTDAVLSIAAEELGKAMNVNQVKIVIGREG